MNPTQQVATSSTAPNNPDVNPTVSGLLKGVQAAQTAGVKTPDYSQYAGVGNTTQNAWNSTLAASNNPDYNAGISGGLGHLSNIAQGQYLNGANPYFEQNLQNGIQDVTAQVNASLGGSGRLGSNLQVEDLTRQIGQLSTGARSQQYETERDRQMQAIQALPSVYQASLAPSAIQGSIGAAQDANAQATRQGQFDLDTRKANEQTDMLAKLSAILAGTAPYGGSTQTDTTPGASPFQQILGAGIAGAGLFL